MVGDAYGRLDGLFDEEDAEIDLLQNGDGIHDLGDDSAARALEVIGVDMDAEDGEQHLRVIHVMELRTKYRSQYEEARRWRV